MGRSTILFVFCLILYLQGCSKETEIADPEPNQLVMINKNLRPLIKGVGSKWVYQREFSPVLDSVFLLSKDPNIVTFNKFSCCDYIDFETIVVKYSPSTLPFLRTHVYHATHISDELNTWSVMRGDIIYITEENLVKLDTNKICGLDNCITLLETIDSLQVQNQTYFRVLHFDIESDKELWWNEEIGVIKFESLQGKWELVRYSLK